MYLALHCHSQDELNAVLDRFTDREGYEIKVKDSELVDYAFEVKYGHDKGEEFHSEMEKLGISRDEIISRLTHYIQLLNAEG